MNTPPDQQPKTCTVFHKPLPPNHPWAHHYDCQSPAQNGGEKNKGFIYAPPLSEVMVEMTAAWCSAHQRDKSECGCAKSPVIIQPAPEPSSQKTWLNKCAACGKSHGIDFICCAEFDGKEAESPSSQQGEWKVVRVTFDQYDNGWWVYLNDYPCRFRIGPFDTKEEAEATAKRICEAVNHYEWKANSSLENWFPLSAEELATLKLRCDSLRDELAKAREENGRLRKIINWLNEPCKEVLSHKAYCETWDQHPLSKCTCGLDELKAQLSILQGQK